MSAQRWLGEMLKLKLREGLVHDLVEDWMQPRRAFQLESAGPIGVNPDQRMHEDARHLTELSSDLPRAGAVVRPPRQLRRVLWAISRTFALKLGDRHFAVPGYMVWAAVIYALSASLLTYWTGRRLIPDNAARYAREADLRYTLVRVNEHIDAITLAGGEADEARRIELDLAAVLTAMRRLVTGLTRVTWVTAGYGWITLVAPILVASPLYFAGSLSFGGLMMAAGGLHSAAILATLVRRQLQHHRRLAGNAAQGGGFPPRAWSRPKCCTARRAALPSSTARANGTARRSRRW